MSTSAISSTPAVRPPWGLAWRLAAGQIFSWGIIYYAFTVVSGPMQTETGWSRPFLNFGLSLGLLAWGICAYPVGLRIQRRGARALMTVASAIGGGGILLMGHVTSREMYLVAWLLVGSSMAGLLYEPAFAVIAATFGPHYRRGITLITLIGGLASTVFIPLTQFAITHAGWRMALTLLGGLHLAVCLPLHWWGGIPRTGAPVVRERPATPTGLKGWWDTFRRDVSDPRFIALTCWFTAYSAAFTGLVFQLVPMLQALDVPDSTIVTAIAFMGPLQVIGRFFLSTHGTGFSSLRVGVCAMSGLFLASLIPLLLPPTFAWLAFFAGAFGLANGLITIVRGTSVAELFGLERYAEINGALTAPGVVAKAASPLALAALWSATHSPRAVPAAAAGLFLLGGGGVYYLIRRQAHRAPALP